MLRKLLISLILWFVACPCAMLAQDKISQEEYELDSIQTRLEIEARLNQFKDNLDEIYTVINLDLDDFDDVGIFKAVAPTLLERMKRIDQTYNALDVKWNTYYQAQQLEIAADENLMELVAVIEAQKQTVRDTIDVKSQKIDAISKFVSADEYIISQVGVYKKLYKKAFRLSLIQKLAPQLEKVKAKEQVVFTSLQASYDQAKASCQVVPALNSRMEVLEEQFVIMKSVSEKVQALEFKPYIQRIKDYLLGLAAVSIIMMFLNSLYSKFKAYKEKVASMKKYNDMLEKNGKATQYPII